MEELRASRLEIVQRLGLAAEYKDNETGLHVIRMSHYSKVLPRDQGPLGRALIAPTWQASAQPANHLLPTRFARLPISLSRNSIYPMEKT
jgi:hypothetical protein